MTILLIMRHTHTHTHTHTNSKNQQIKGTKPEINHYNYFLLWTKSPNSKLSRQSHLVNDKNNKNRLLDWLNKPELL